jgi:hypothetical protein
MKDLTRKLWMRPSSINTRALARISYKVRNEPSLGCTRISPSLGFRHAVNLHTQSICGAESYRDRSHPVTFPNLNMQSSAPLPYGAHALA